MQIAKKGLLYFLIISLCLMFIPGTAFAEVTQWLADEETVSELPADEMISNGGFEEIDEATKGPKDWDAFNAQNVAEGFEWENNNVSVIESKTVKSGKTSLKLDFEKGAPIANLAYASQKVYGVKKGATYEMSFWAYATSDNNLFCFYYEDYLNGSNTSSVQSAYVPLVAGKWTKHIWRFKLINTADYIRFYPFLRGGSIVYVDDISMKMIEEPEFGEVSTNEVYYYTDLDQGWAIFDLNSYYEEMAKDWTVGFKFLDGEEILDSVDGLKFSSLRLEWIFNPKLMTDRDKAYTMRVELKNKDGNVVHTDDARLHRRYDRPKTFTRDGKIMNNEGEIYLPIDGYEVYDHLGAGVAIYDHLKRMGGTCLERFYRTCLSTDMTGVIEILDDFYYNKGLMVMVDLYSGPNMAASPENIEGVKALVETVKDHPAVFAYNLGDEPTAKGFTAELMEASYRLVKDIDPIHPVYICDQRTSHVRDFYKYTDIVGTDNYNYGGINWASYITTFWQDLENTFQRSGKPAMDILQTFKRQPHPPWDKYPSPVEIRNLLYQCLFEDVAALGYYTFMPTFDYPDGSKLSFYQMEMGDAIEDWMKYEKEDAVNYFLKEEYPTFDGKQLKDINYRAYVKDGCIYYIVLNRNAEESVEFEIDVKSLNGKVDVKAFKGSVVCGTECSPLIEKSRKGILSAILAPAEAAIFKVEPLKKINEDLLSLPIEPIFKDLDGFEWAKTQIEDLYEKDIVNEMSAGKYEPNTDITRGDFAMFLIRSLGVTAETDQNFADVHEESSYAKEVAIGKKLGIFKGDGGKFNPGEKISRQDIMTLCARGLEYVNKLDSDPNETALDGFTDKDDISDYALSAVSDMVKMGIIQGNDDNTINPLGKATRAEAAVIMYRIMNK